MSVSRYHKENPGSSHTRQISASPTPVNAAKDQSLIVIFQELGLALNSCDSKKDVIDASLEAVAAIPGLDAAGIYLKDRREPRYVITGRFGLPDELPSLLTELPFTSPIAQTMDAGQSLFSILPEIFSPGELPAAFENLFSAALIPMVFRNQTIACLTAASAGRDGFNASQRAALLAITASTGAALNRIYAEQDLRRSEQIYRSLINNSLDIVCILDSEGMVEFLSPSVKQALGFEPEEIIGHSTTEFIHPDDVERIQDVITELALTPGATGSTEFRHRCGDGGWRYLESVGCSRVDEDRTQIIVNSRDITERKRLEEEFRAREERMRISLEGSNVGLWDWDIPSGEVQRSRHWAEIIGYDPKEIESSVKRWEESLHPEDSEETLRLLQDCLAGKTDFYESEHRLPAKNGEWRWMLDRGRVILRDPDGKPLRMVGVHLDITAQKKAEAALEEARDELERRVLERTSQLENARQQLENSHQRLHTNQCIIY